MRPLRVAVALLLIGGVFAIAPPLTMAGVSPFKPAVELTNPVPKPSAHDPVLAPLPGGGFIAAWANEMPSPGGYIEVRGIGADGAITAVRHPAGAVDDSFRSALASAIAPDGTPLILFSEDEPAMSPTIVALTLDHDLRRETITELGPGSIPAVSFAADGRGLAAWTDLNGAWIAPVGTDGTVGAPVLLPAIDLTAAGKPSIVFDEEGARVYWLGGAGIWEARVTDEGEPVSADLVLTTDAGHYYSLPAVAGGWLVTVRTERSGSDVVCVPLDGGEPETITHAVSKHPPRSRRMVTVDVAAGEQRAVVASTLPPKPGRMGGVGPPGPRVATIGPECAVTSRARLLVPGRLSYETAVAYADGVPTALVAGKRGVSVFRVSHTGRVQSDGLIAGSRRLSDEPRGGPAEAELELLGDPAPNPAAVWTTQYRGSGYRVQFSRAR